MGFTVLGITEAKADGKLMRRLLVSNEYSTFKIEGVSDWQHPDPKDLLYTDLGSLTVDERWAGLLGTLFHFGTRTFGSNWRYIEDDASEIAAGREQAWEAKTAQDQEFVEHLKREQYEQELLEQKRRTPIYEFCPRCGAMREACKGRAHRGNNKCMTCCGGVGDTSNRYCSNCLDLPFRQKREEFLGEKIVYAGEGDYEAEDSDDND